jgi:hypothetical protein
VNSPQKIGLKWQMAGELPRAAPPVARGYFPLWVLVGVSQGLGSKQTANNAAMADANRDPHRNDKMG